MEKIGGCINLSEYKCINLSERYSSEDAVPVIVKAWFGKEGASNAKKLLVHLKNDSAIASLTENPLLLSLLCIQFKHDLSLPKRIVLVT